MFTLVKELLFNLVHILVVFAAVYAVAFVIKASGIVDFPDLLPPWRSN